MRFPFVLALCALVLAAAPASAALTPVDDPRGRGLIGVALEYWHARGVVGCPQGVAFYYDDLDALGLGGGCVARLDTEHVAAMRAPDLGRWTRRSYAARECHDWTHEAGHALGLPHTDEGVMDPYAYAIPAECRAWARAAYPPRKPKRRGPRSSGASRRAAR